ncbi:hypothetical protein D3C75_391200 [compost metagenome]
MADGAAPADAAAQLVQLRQAQAFRVLDDHQAGVGHVHADFDHRGRDQQLQVAGLEFGHHRGFFRRLHAAVDQPDLQFAEGGGEVLKSGFGGLAGQLFRLFDQRAHPIGLAPFGASAAHPFDDFDPPGVGDQHGVDRGSAGGQFVEDRGVEVGVGTHGQRARNRRGGHDQLVRAHAPADAFLPQGQTLLYAETVLFVDDHQCQVLELHFVLEQRVGADHHRRAAGDLLQRGDAVLALELAGQPRDFNAQRLEPALEGDEVLLGENLGGRHQRNLITGLQRLQRGKGGDHGFAGADIALDQPQHRFVLAEVIGDFVANPLLGTGRAEAEVGQVFGWQLGSFGHRGRTQGAHAFTKALLRQLMGQQFFESQTVLRPVVTEGQFIDVGIGGRVVQVADRIGQRRQLVVAGQFARQPVGQAAGAEQGEGLHAQLAQALLGQALGERVDRGQGFIHWRRFVAGDGAVFRVVDLQPRSTGPRFAVAANPRAAFEAFLLRVAEMVEAQAESAGAILQPDHQAAPTPHDHIGTADSAFDDRILTGPQCADRHHASAVLITQGQVKQHVLEVFQADLGQFLGHGFTDTLECRHRHLRQLAHDRCLARSDLRRWLGHRAQANGVGEDFNRFRAREAGAPGNGHGAERYGCRQRTHLDYAGGVVMAVDRRQRQDRNPETRGDHVANGFQGAGFHRGVLGAVVAFGQGRAGFQYLVAEAVAFAEQQQALVIEQAGVDGFLLCPRVLRRHQHVERLVVELQGQHVGFIERQGDDDRVELAVAQFVAQHVGEVFFDVQRHLRGDPVQLRNQVWEQVRADGVDRADFQRRGQLVLAGLGQFADALRLLEDFLRLGDDAFADRGQAHGAFAALENQHTEFVFKLFHAHRQGRLADVATLGRVAEVLLLGEGNDVA